MMAARFLSRHAYKFILQYCQYQKSCNNILLTLRRYGKQYNYDLDSLIEWRKDTVRAFGSPRKYTKTGKIKKNGKIPDKQITDGLEAFSALSASASISCDNDYKTGNAHTEISGIKGVKNSTDDSIPEYCFEERVPVLDNAMPSIHQSSGLSEERFDKEMTEDGIYIPEIKPVPQTAFNVKVAKQIPKPSSQETMNNPISKYDPEKITDLDTSQKSGSCEIEERRVIPEKGLNEIVSQDERLKFGTDTTTSITTKATSKSDSVSLKFSLPVEPPESFNLITEFPLIFDENGMLSRDLLRKVENYKSDVGKIGLKTLPPVKTILNKTMPELSRFFLSRWREGMIKELGEEGFRLHQEATIKRGINLHANIMELLSGKPLSEIQVMPDNEGHWASLQSAMKLIEDVYALEAAIIHPYLSYRGVFDCIARYKDLLCVVDWKTSKKPRPLLKNTYDDPLQIAAYVGALNATNTCKDNTKEFDQINHGLIVVVYPDGSPAHIHMMNQSDCEKYWHDWTERLYQYYQLMYTTKHR